MPVVFETAAFEASFMQLHAALHDRAHDEWGRLADEARGYMVEHGYRDKTGLMSRDMVANTFTDGWCDFRAVVTSFASYSLWVDQATKPHWIPKSERGRSWYASYNVNEHGPRVTLRRGKNNAIYRRKHKVLRWFVGGVAHFARRVWHPGWHGAHFSDHMAAAYSELFPVGLQTTLDSTVQANG